MRETSRWIVVLMDDETQPCTRITIHGTQLYVRTDTTIVRTLPTHQVSGIIAVVPTDGTITMLDECIPPEVTRKHLVAVLTTAPRRLHPSSPPDDDNDTATVMPRRPGYPHEEPPLRRRPPPPLPAAPATAATAAPPEVWISYPTRYETALDTACEAAALVDADDALTRLQVEMARAMIRSIRVALKIYREVHRHGSTARRTHCPLTIPWHQRLQPTRLSCSLWFGGSGGGGVEDEDTVTSRWYWTDAETGLPLSPTWDPHLPVQLSRFLLWHVLQSPTTKNTPVPAPLTPTTSIRSRRSLRMMTPPPALTYLPEAILLVLSIKALSHAPLHPHLSLRTLTHAPFALAHDLWTMFLSVVHAWLAQLLLKKPSLWQGIGTTTAKTVQLVKALLRKLVEDRLTVTIDATDALTWRNTVVGIRPREVMRRGFRPGSLSLPLVSRGNGNVRPFTTKTTLYQVMGHQLALLSEWVKTFEDRYAGRHVNL